VHVGRPGLLVLLEFAASEPEREAWAEASPLPGFGASVDSFELAQQELTSFDERELDLALAAPPLEALSLLFRATQVCRSGAARHALEWATIEALSARHRVGSAELVLAWLRQRSTPHAWPGLRSLLCSSAVLDLLDPELEVWAERFGARGIRCWKLKCGRDEERELSALSRLAALGFPARLRLDPGCAWTLEQARHFISVVREVCRLSRLSLEFVEDPTAHPEEWAALGELCPLAADEVLTRDPKSLELRGVSHWVLKPMVHGVGGCLELALLGASRGAQLLLSHSFDGPLALRAATELACAVQTHDASPGLGPHVALDAWQALELARGQSLRGDRLGPRSFGREVHVDGPYLARTPQAFTPGDRSRLPSAVAWPAGDGLSISRAGALYGDRPFLDLPTADWSFADVARRVERDGAPPSSPFVPLVAEPTPDAIVALLAALEHGIPVLLLHPSSPAHEHQRLIERAERHAGDLQPGDAILVPTSGSTREPRLVIHTRGSLLASISASAVRLGAPTDGTRWLLSLTFAHVGGLLILLRSLALGGTVVVARSARTPKELAPFLAEKRVTHLSLVPTQLARLLDDPSFVFPASVRSVLVGGAAASPSLRASAALRHAPVSYTYGLTEMASQVATERPSAETAETAETAGEISTSSVGQPLVGVNVVVDDDQRLSVGGPMLMRGYLGEEPLRAGALFRTGDAGQLDEHGALSLLGRLDDLIISGGENVAPQLVEAALGAVAGVSEVCVVGLPSAEWGQTVVAAVVPRDRAQDREHLARELEAVARAHLPTFARPKAYRFLDAWPLLATGKIDRRQLFAQLASELPGAGELKKE